MTATATWNGSVAFEYYTAAAHRFGLIWLSTDGATVGGENAIQSGRKRSERVRNGNTFELR